MCEVEVDQMSSLLEEDYCVTLTRYAKGGVGLELFYPSILLPDLLSQSLSKHCHESKQVSMLYLILTPQMPNNWISYTLVSGK